MPYSSMLCVMKLLQKLAHRQRSGCLRCFTTTSILVTDVRSGTYFKTLPIPAEKVEMLIYRIFMNFQHASRENAVHRYGTFLKSQSPTI